MRTCKLAAVTIAIALAAPAVAQQPPNKPDPSGSAAAAGGFLQNQGATDWRGSKLIGATVYGADNASIGEINDLLVANDGKLKAAVIGVGGFLGVGEKDVAIPFDRLTISRNAGVTTIDKVTVNYDKEALRKAPNFTYQQAPPATTGSSVTDKIRGMNPMRK